MKSIKKIIMKRDNITEIEANKLIEMAIEELKQSYDNEICYKWFRLGPNYIWNLLEEI